MSFIPSIDVSPDYPTHLDEDRSLGENSFQRTVASSDASPGVQRSITPTNNTETHHSDGTNETSTASSPPLDRYRPRTSPIESQEGIVPANFHPDGFNKGTTEVLEAPSSSASYASNGVQRPTETQQQAVPPVLSGLIDPSEPESGSSSAISPPPRSKISPTPRLKKEGEELRKEQEGLQIDIDGPSRTPMKTDFPPALSMTIVKPVKPVENCIILLHNRGTSEEELKDHVQTLQSKRPMSVFILLRGLESMPGNSGYHWADVSGSLDEGFIRTSRVILEDIIRDCLVTKCRFRPRDIVVLGHGQGGMAALAAIASWNCVEFGGVVSFGGPMPVYAQMPANTKARTPAFLYGSACGNIDPTASRRIQETFIFTEHHYSPGEDDIVPLTDDQIGPLLDFYAHRLGREEWKRQAVFSFDGGGIRGYGSLLILRALMNKIGDLEKELDDKIESSFSPQDYKPTKIRPINASGMTENTFPPDPSDLGSVGPTKSHGLRNSALFLPCHYFTYAAGTSTGGLISIMLSRFRMTVDDCIEEYKSLGNKIFGHPRRMARGGFPWHRFNARVFEEVIRDVDSRHNIRIHDLESHYGMDRTDEDMSQCIVLAYSNNVSNDGPYLFRTYGAQAPPLDPNRSRIRQRTFRNPGGASMLPIWKVARATSAAPGYFPPIKIKTGNGSEVIKFKDGGFGSNNPSVEAHRDIVHKHGGSMHMGPFISIGTGITPLDMFGERSDNLSTLFVNAKAAINLASRTLKAHENMGDLAIVDDEERFPYFRFDGGPDLGKVDLDEWETHRLTRVTGKDGTSGLKTLQKIETAVDVYLGKEDVQKDLMKCAKLLVNRRRLRARDASAWDRYASYSYYECDLKGCQKQRVNTALDFKEHLRKYHRFVLVDPVIDNKVSECRRVQWLYQPTDTFQETTARKKGKSRV